VRLAVIASEAKQSQTLNIRFGNKPLRGDEGIARQSQLQQRTYSAKIIYSEFCRLSKAGFPGAGE